jgi:hypothetical protein
MDCILRTRNTLLLLEEENSQLHMHIMLVAKEDSLVEVEEIEK